MLQHSCSHDVAANEKKVHSGIKEAARQNADLILLQELHFNTYFCQQQDAANFDLALTIPGPSIDALRLLAKQCDIVIVACVFEKRAQGLYHNTAVVIDNSGDIAGTYRKMHIPHDPGYNEKFYFTPGDQGFQPIPTRLGKLGVLICWDQWFPEAARLMALAGADLLLYPTAIGWDPRETKDEQKRQLDAWQTIQRSHAIANALPVIVTNRVGFEADLSKQTQGIQFWGSSFATDATGTVLSIADNAKDTLQIVDINIADTEKHRRTWPFFRDRRTEHYSDIALRYRD